MSKYNKAISAFIGALVPVLTALVANQIVTGSAADAITVICAGLTPVFAALGPYLGPANTG